MKSKTSFINTTLLAVMVLFFTQPSVAQSNTANQRMHAPRYRAVDIGAFGGPSSYVNPAWELGGPNQMNHRGSTVGAAATTVSNFLGCPFCNGLGGQAQKVFRAFKWSHGAVHELGALPGKLTTSVAVSINAEGSAVGHSENGEIDPLTGVREFRAVLWEDGRIEDLGTFGGSHSVAAMINDRGQIVGSALNATADPFSFIGVLLGSSNSTQTRAFLWENGHKRDLGTLGGPDAAGGRLNDRGEVAGVSYTSSIPNTTTGLPTQDPFLWRKGKMIDLGNFGGNLSGVAAINNRGQVIGAASLPGDQSFDPFLWDDGQFIDLYSSTKGGNPYTANALNDAGEIVGASAFLDHPYDAYVWKNGVATDLGFLDGDCYSEAFVINSKGQVAGQSYSCDWTTARSFLWQDGTMLDLNKLIHSDLSFTFTQAFVINDHGEIGGIGTLPGCEVDDDCGHAFVLVPSSGESDDGTDANEGVIDTTGGARPNATSAGSAAAIDAGLPPRELAARIQDRFGGHRRLLMTGKKRQF